MQKGAWRNFIISTSHVTQEKTVNYGKVVDLFCSYNPSSNFNFYLWNGILLFQQPLQKHHARLFYNSIRLLTPCTNCHNLVTTLSQQYKVAARLLQPSYFCMGMHTHTSEYMQHTRNADYKLTLDLLHYTCVQVQ